MYSALSKGVANYGSMSNYAGSDLTGVMSSWISQPGHPILNVAVNYENSTIVLNQVQIAFN